MIEGASTTSHADMRWGTQRVSLSRETGGGPIQIKIIPNEKGNPVNKLADAELHFTDGPLAGLKLIGLAILERRTGIGRNVTLPARQ